jgi:hypothetical protein
MLVERVSYQLFCSCGERGVGNWTPAHYDTPWQVCRGICTRSIIMIFASSSCNLWQVRVSNRTLPVLYAGEYRIDTTIALRSWRCEDVTRLVAVWGCTAFWILALMSFRQCVSLSCSQQSSGVMLFEAFLSCAHSAHAGLIDCDTCQCVITSAGTSPR